MIATALLMALAACGSSTPDPSVNLFGEYVKDTNVAHDRMGAGSGSGDDRMANFAAYYSVDELKCRLLCAFRCAASGSRGGDGFDAGCDLTEAAGGALRDLGASMPDLQARVLLVKHDNGSLDLVTVYLANSRVIDAAGGVFASLDDFRAHNGVLSSSDIMPAPRDLTSTSGDTQLVTVYGHTPSQWWPWVVGLLMVLVGLLVLLIRRKRYGGGRSA